MTIAHFVQKLSWSFQAWIHSSWEKRFLTDVIVLEFWSGSGNDFRVHLDAGRFFLGDFWKLWSSKSLKVTVNLLIALPLRKMVTMPPSCMRQGYTWRVFRGQRYWRLWLLYLVLQRLVSLYQSLANKWSWNWNDWAENQKFFSLLLLLLRKSCQT